METNAYKEAHNIGNERAPTISLTATQPSVEREPIYSLSLLELNILVGDQVTVAGMLNPRSQIMVIRRDLAKEVNTCINPNHLIEMEGENGATN